MEHSGETRAGRPRASSRETLAEAACELFLEQGYEATSVADITRRAGVSRSSFFNYFSSKSDVLWSGLDTRIAQAAEALAALDADATGRDVRAQLAAAVRDFVPDPLALALRNAAVMGLDDELARDTGLRQVRLARAVSDAARRSGRARLRADLLGAAYAAALFSALRLWAEQGSARDTLERRVSTALDEVADLGWA